MIFLGKQGYWMLKKYLDLYSITTDFNTIILMMSK